MFSVIFLVIVVGNVFFSANQNVTGRQENVVSQLENDLGAAPMLFEPATGILQGNNTQVVFLWYSPCNACEENNRNLYISQSYPAWQGNLTSSEVTFSNINYYRKTEAGDFYFKTFNVPESQRGGSFLVVHNSKVGLAYYPPFKDSKIQQGVYYITRGSQVVMPTERAPTDKLETLTPYLALAGLVAIVSAVVAVKKRRD